jgi:protein-disulfide isomerase
MVVSGKWRYTKHSWSPIRAESRGVDTGRFGAELAEHVHAPKVREDFMSGVRSGVNGTPTFYINSVRHDGSWDAGALMAALQRAAGAPVRV